MCLIIATLFLVLAVVSFLHGDMKAAILHGGIATFFYILMGWNIRRVWKNRHGD